MSDSLRPHGWQPARLLCPWDSPGKNTGVGCYATLQRTFPTQGFSSLAGEFFTTEPPGKPKLPNRKSNFQFEVLEGIQGYRTQNVAQDNCIQKGEWERMDIGSLFAERGSKCSAGECQWRWFGGASDWGHVAEVWSLIKGSAKVGGLESAEAPS